MIRIVLLIFYMFITITNSFRVVGWYNADYNTISNIDFSKYTHIVTGFPKLYENGTVECNKSDNITQTIIQIAHKKNVKVQWRSGAIYKYDSDNSSIYLDNYAISIKKAVEDCNIDGIELDYEWANTFMGKLGIITPSMADKYTDYVAKLKKILGKDKIVSVDVGTWQPCLGYNCGYIFGVLPWINVTKFNSGAFDFINSMSYYWNEKGDIHNWKWDYFFFSKVWKYNMSKVNLGIPYFSMKIKGFKIQSEPSWNTLSKYCPNSLPKNNICEETVFVGKQMNYDLGKFSKSVGYGGVFPWTINYDSFTYNNSLINWLIKGINSV